MVEMKIPFDYDNATEEERRAFQKWLWEHPEYDNPARAGQRRVVVKIAGYPCIVPFVVEQDGGWFLKTAYKCRKAKGRI